MNRLTLLLQDKEVISEIAKDPEVQIKIKDAILEGAIKRASKLTNGISEQIAVIVKNEMLNSTGWSKNLKPEIVELVRSEAKNMVSDLVPTEAKLLNEEVNRKFEYYKMLIIGKMEDLDADRIIRDEIRKAVNEKFK